jgi:hypothetical protein
MQGSSSALRSSVEEDCVFHAEDIFHAKALRRDYCKGNELPSVGCFGRSSLAMTGIGAGILVAYWSTPIIRITVFHLC